jgi:IS4 transposase
LVEDQVEESGEVLRFITNIWDLTAMDIARIYARRWDIEVFLPFLKQELNIKHLLNYSENGVKIQIYCALSTAILLLVYKTTNKIQGYKQAKSRFEDQLLMLIIKTLEDNKHPKGKGVIFAGAALPAP